MDGWRERSLFMCNSTTDGILPLSIRWMPTGMSSSFAGERMEVGEASQESADNAELLRDGGERDGVLVGTREMERETEDWREA